MLRRAADGNRPSAFPQFFQRSDKSVWAIREIPVITPNFAALTVEHNDGGEAFDLVFLGQPLVLFLQGPALLFCAGKIDLQQNEILVRVILKLRFGEYLPV